MGQDPLFDSRPGAWFGNYPRIADLRNEYARFKQQMAQANATGAVAVDLARSPTSPEINIDKMPLLDYLRARTKEWLKDVKL